MNIPEGIELWRDIEYPICDNGIYQVSNLGRIRNITYYKKKVHVLKPECRHTTSRYNQVKLKRDGIFSRCKVHRLVARAFLGMNYFDSTQIVCHKNDIRIDNNVNNLHVGSYKENSQDARLKDRGKIPCAKLKVSDVIRVKERLIKNISINDIAKEFGVSYHNIYNIKRGKTRSYVCVPTFTL